MSVREANSRALAYCASMHLHLVQYELFGVNLLDIYVCAIKEDVPFETCSICHETLRLGMQTRI